MIVVNTPIALDSQASFLSNYRQYLISLLPQMQLFFIIIRFIAPEGLLVLTGFDKVNEWLQCVGVDSKAVLTSETISIHILIR